MSIRLIPNMLDYVTQITDLEENSGNTPIYSMLSFISSFHFPEFAISRYFRNEDVAGVATNLISRRMKFLQHRATVERLEILEIDAIANLLRVGMPHASENNYRSFPSEIDSVLNSLIDSLKNYENYKLAFTIERIPFVFHVCNDVIIDVKQNYNYQKIQGFHIKKESNLRKDIILFFEQQWTSSNTISDRSDVLDLLCKVREIWQSGKMKELEFLPNMIESDFN